MRSSRSGDMLDAMTPDLAQLEKLAARPHVLGEALGDELLERPVRDLMTPGCVIISENASVADAAEALACHRIHAILIVGSNNGTPLGWVTVRGLLAWLERDRNLASAREAITEQVTEIGPSERARTALHALSAAGTTRLLVRAKPHQLPEGVITDFDLAIAARR